MRIALLPPRRTVLLAGRFMTARHQTAVRKEITSRGKATNVSYFVENHHRQDVTDSRHAFQTIEDSGVVDSGELAKFVFDGGDLLLLDCRGTVAAHLE